jgi:hypothetical protein
MIRTFLSGGVVLVTGILLARAFGTRGLSYGSVQVIPDDKFRPADNEGNHLNDNPVKHDATSNIRDRMTSAPTSKMIRSTPNLVSAKRETGCKWKTYTNEE